MGKATPLVFSRCIRIAVSDVLDFIFSRWIVSNFSCCITSGHPFDQQKGIFDIGGPSALRSVQRDITGPGPCCCSIVCPKNSQPETTDYRRNCCSHLHLLTAAVCKLKEIIPHAASISSSPTGEMIAGAYHKESSAYQKCVSGRLAFARWENFVCKY
jgi:hypothetical protein